MNTVSGKGIRFLQTGLVILGLFLFMLPASAGAKDVKRVLLLNSYALDIEWTDALSHAVKSTLQKSDPQIKLSMEFMDTKNFSSPEFFASLKQEYYLKYKNITFDVIITSDDNAMNFVLDNRHDLFHDAPVVFCGVNDQKVIERPSFKNMTGIFEATEIAETIRSALRLQPDIETMYFIVDDTHTGHIMRSRIEKMEPEFKGQVKFDWLDNMSMTMLKETLASLPDSSVAFLATYTKDIIGQRFTFGETITELYKSSRIPIYGLWDFYLNKGIVGGMLTSGHYQGLMAAEMALDILSGTKASDLPVVSHKANHYMFDYNVLKKFGLDRGRLPKGSIVINVPVTFYQQYTYQVWAGVFVFLFFMMVIIKLLSDNAARRKAEAELEEMNQYQETLIESRTEELTKRSRELEMANYELTKLDELKTAVLNTVSHDLRTPLTAVLGFCKIIDRDFNKFFLPLCKENNLEKKAERIRSNLSIIENEGERLTRLVNDFLDLSKIESGEIAWHDVSVDPKQLITQAKPVLEGYFTDSDVKLELVFKKELPHITADPDRLLQVLNNLVGNAAKFTNSGSVTIIGDTTEGGWLKVTVADTGVGIPSHELCNVFDKFYQVPKMESDISVVSRGSGMGLAISKRIVEHYRGTITAHSEANIGSSFTFTIPSAG